MLCRPPPKANAADGDGASRQSKTKAADGAAQPKEQQTFATPPKLSDFEANMAAAMAAREAQKEAAKAKDNHKTDKASKKDNTLMKRPAAAKACGADAPKKTPAAAAAGGAHSHPLKRTTGKKPHPCPTAHGATAHGLGKVYTDMKNRRFRIIQDATQYRTERQFKWEGKKPTAAEWKRAVQQIDEYWK